MPTIGTPKIDFSFYQTFSPKDLVIVDLSHWGALSNRPAKISITTPGSSKAKTYSFLKNTWNVFNSNNLYENCGECREYEDLEDGIYTIEIESTTPYEATKYYLKTDATRLKLSKRIVDIGFEYNNAAESLYDEIQKIQFYLDSAESNVKLGYINEGRRAFQEVDRLLSKCKTCH